MTYDGKGKWSYSFLRREKLNVVLLHVERGKFMSKIFVNKHIL